MPKHAVLSTQQRAYQSFELLPCLIPFASLWHAVLILNKAVYINMNYSYPTTISVWKYFRQNVCISGRKNVIYNFCLFFYQVTFFA